MLTATTGFDAAGRPAEVFLSGAKNGSGVAGILNDASVVISIAPQHRIPARALAINQPCTRWSWRHHGGIGYWRGTGLDRAIRARKERPVTCQSGAPMPLCSQTAMKCDDGSWSKNRRRLP